MQKVFINKEFKKQSCAKKRVKVLREFRYAINLDKKIAAFFTKEI